MSLKVSFVDPYQLRLQLPAPPKERSRLLRLQDAQRQDKRQSPLELLGVVSEDQQPIRPLQWRYPSVSNVLLPHVQWRLRGAQKLLPNRLVFEHH
jgi:hypothetical protein